jgi:hypothetical protein
MAEAKQVSQDGEGMIPTPTAFIEPKTAGLKGGIHISVTESMPSNWEVKIYKDENGNEIDGLVKAMSNVSGKCFEGTIKDFYRFLRGEPLVDNPEQQ